MIIDLRSDTVTRPTPEMLDFMMSAAVGDDVFGEDPTINALEEKVAGIFGKEAAIFCPSGTMTNQIAIRLFTFPGAEVICHIDSHVYNYEGGGIAVNSLSSVRLLHGDRGRIRADQLAEAVNPEDVHKPVSSLICVEDTSNRGGGCCYSHEELVRIRDEADRLGLPLHNDGARVFNALVRKGTDTTVYGALFDTMSICLSKGLGAPVGSVLVGSRENIHNARRIRKVMGGGMRQAGILAAAGIYALDNHISRMKHDHDRAQIIGKELEKLAFVSEVFPVETNILVFRLADNVNPKAFLDLLKSHDILAVSFGGQLIRFVTHLDFGDDRMTELLSRLKKINI